MDEDELALLAELKAISARSLGSSRFSDSNIDHSGPASSGSMTTSIKTPKLNGAHTDENEHFLNSSASSMSPVNRNTTGQSTRLMMKARAAMSAKDPSAAVVLKSPTQSTATENSSADRNINSTTYGVKPNTVSSPAASASPLSPKGFVRNDSTTTNDELPPWKRGFRSNRKTDALVEESSKSLDLNDENQELVDQTTSPRHNKELAADSNNGSKLRKSAVVPWKSRKSNKKLQNNIEEVIEPQPESLDTTNNDVNKHPNDNKLNTVSTFVGERGGVAEDAELLALLRGVSAKSSSSRFDEEVDNYQEVGKKIDQTLGLHERPPEKSEATVEGVPAHEQAVSRATPPWKKGSRKNSTVMKALNEAVSSTTEHNNDISAKNAGCTDTQNSFKAETKSKYQGERGGQAEDVELLALLKGVSEKAGSSRFDDICTNDHSNVSFPSASLPKPSLDNNNISVVPTNRGVSQDSKNTGLAVDPRSGIKSEIKSTFMGERGGVAEDPELLALLRGVSVKSSTSRYEGRDNSDYSATNCDTGQTSAIRGSRTQSKANTCKENAHGKQNADSTMTATNEANMMSTKAYGIKSDPSSFKGERGGIAEDPELLALLRGVSENSTAGRFDGDDVTKKNDSKNETIQSATSETNLVPPWKTKKKIEARLHCTPRMSDSQGAEYISENQEALFGIKSEITSTFKGERGGIAEDAELLALLRGVSAQASTRRFNDQEADDDNGAKSSSTIISSFGSQSEILPPDPQLNDDVGESSTKVENAAEITRDELPSSLIHKNWKIRSQAYSLLSQIISELALSARGSLVDSNDVLVDLDDRIPSFVEDTSNAVALDKALEFAIAYADKCKSAGSADIAAKLMSSLLKKSAFSSRPKTIQLANSLALKLMEVGNDGNASVHAIVDVLLNQGLTSKNPKIVQASASLILDAARNFGAESLPLASIKISSPKLLAHSNAKVREMSLQTIAEICRALGSKSPLQSVIDSMKKAQMTDLDSLLTQQPGPTPPLRGLRCQKKGFQSSSEGALAVLQTGTKELEAKRFASRPSIDLVFAISKTDYATRLSLSKWSEKVAALDTIIECAGEKPYKLADAASVNYNPLISEMKKLLSHTHFAVVAKAMSVLSVLAEGVGEKLYPFLRPILSLLLQLTKDKKLTRQTLSCLDSFFGNVLSFEHLLDADDALPAALDEKKQKNALVRSSSLEFLAHCVERRDSAGPRGILQSQTAAELARLCVHKLDDSDASVRKASTGVLEHLLKVENASVRKSVLLVVETLKTSNSRAYKSLIQIDVSGVTEPTTFHVTPVLIGKKDSIQEKQIEKGVASAVASTKDAVCKPVAKLSQNSYSGVFNDPISSINAALSHVEKLRIPLWASPADEGGILAGLQETKWIVRQNAVLALTSFIESGEIDRSVNDVPNNTEAMLIVVKEHTRGFKETNVNIMKSILGFLIAICEYHAAKEIPPRPSIVNDATDTAVQKISDRKLTQLSKDLLTRLCIIAPPGEVLLRGFMGVKGVKSPVAHEEYLNWCHTFCNDFGALAIGSPLSEIIPCLLEEFCSSNAKVKREAYGLIGVLHKHIGPMLRSLSLSMAKQPPVKEHLQKCFDENAFDGSLPSTKWAKQSINYGPIRSDNPDTGTQPALSLEIPKTDLILVLPKDILSRLGSKDGKTAWKIRKEAMEEIETAIKGCVGLIDTSASKLKPLAALLRALKDRLSDTQMNLKPVAARIIGSLLLIVDKIDQSKLGRLVYGSLISCVMNDIKKPMRDACLDALRQGTSLSPLDGGGVNSDTMESFLAALVGEVTEASSRAAGVFEVLDLTLTLVDHLPNLDHLSASRGHALSIQFAGLIVECLTSSKSETRSSASSLLDASISKGIIGTDTVQKAADRLKPAKQRTVAPVISKYSKKSAVIVITEEESKPSTDASRSPASGFAASSLVSDVDESLLKLAQRQAPFSAESDPQFLPPILPSPILSRCKQPLRPPKSILWPDFPEEPNTIALANLRKFWSPFLQPAAVTALFPLSGITKQDEARAGCEVLTLALELDISGKFSSIPDHLDPIFKWITFGLCSKETTTGLQDLLALLHRILKYLLEKGIELSDSEALTIIPYVIEKAGVSKGRFRDSYVEIVTLVQSERLLSQKCLGGIVCVAVIEGSSQPRARAFAYRCCIDCVDKSGLAGVGKRGVLATAKSLTRETIVESKIAALDLLEIILSKMNGDVQRLVKICGQNLNEKGRQLLEERISRKDSSFTTETPVRRSSLRPQSAPSSSSRREKENQTDIYDELPRLSLRQGNLAPGNLTRESPKQSVTHDILRHSALDPFSFSYLSRKTPLSPKINADIGVIPESNSFDTSSFSARTEGISVRTEGESSTAASLRARLLRIREKGKTTESESATEPALFATEDPQTHQTFLSEDLSSTFYMLNIETLRLLSIKPRPIHDDDPQMIKCLDSLKRFHASLSKQQQHSALGMTSDQVACLRFRLIDHIDQTVEEFARMIDFAFDCGYVEVNSGMSIPLLSVCLATLMALFRDAEISTKVGAASLRSLIKITGTALLDTKLSSSSDLDESTASQMVRSINKLAVQAAIGAKRHISLQALMTLQQQLLLEPFRVDNRQNDFNGRLARIVTKLFARVLKAEESLEDPYNAASFDTDSILSSMEDCLRTCKNVEQRYGLELQENVEVCRKLVNDLVCSFLESQQDFSSLRTKLDALGLAPNCLLATVISNCEEEVDLRSEPKVIQEIQVERQAGALSPLSTSQSMGPSKDVASLVAAVASSSHGYERESAVDALRSYVAVHGNEELDSHLQQVSGTFREFVEGHLNRVGGDDNGHDERSNRMNMSERLRNLRSRLQATEVSVHSAVPDSTSDSSPPPLTSHSMPVSSHATQSRLSAPSPSRLSSHSSDTRLGTSFSSGRAVSTTQSLRERLAASQETRKTGPPGTNAIASPMSRAAALRARLEAVKRQETN